MTIFYFDICAIAIYLIILATIVAKRNYRGTVNKMFTLFVGHGLLTAVFSMFSAFFSNDLSLVSSDVRYLLQSCYLWLRASTGIMYVLYIVCLADIWHIFLRKKTMLILTLSSTVIVAFFLLINSLNSKMFYLDEAGNYIRGDWFFILYVSAAFYFVLGVVFLAKYGKLLGRLKRLSVLTLAIFAFAAVIIQYIFPNWLVEMFAHALSLLIIFLIVQRPEDVVDMATRLRKYTAYYNDMAKAFLTKKNMNVILISITNYNCLIDVIGDENELSLLRDIASILESANSHIRYKGVLYHLSRGAFRFVLNEKNTRHTQDICNRINAYAAKSRHVADMEINLKTVISVIDCPNDIDNYADFASFDREIKNIITKEGEIIRYDSLDEQYKIMPSNVMGGIIAEAMDSNMLKVKYQPVYSVEKQKYVSVEASLYIEHSEYGVIEQSVFFPAAEKLGYSGKLRNFVIDSVCRFVVSDEFKLTGFDYVEIAFSENQCFTREIVRNVIDIANIHGADLWKICINIPNAQLKKSLNVLNDNMYFFINNSVRMTVSDFIVGDSDMLKISQLPFENIKITLNKKMVDDEKYWIVLKSTVATLRQLGFNAVIKNVSDTEQYERVIKSGCALVQGDYFSGIVEENDLLKLTSATRLY